MTDRISSSEPKEEEDLRIKLNRETAKIGWDELQKFYAKGMVVCVAKEMDLIDVACEFSRDNKPVVEPWLQAGCVARATDEQALAWHDGDAVVWAVVVAPWVLVQDVEIKS